MKCGRNFREFEKVYKLFDLSLILSLHLKKRFLNESSPLNRFQLASQAILGKGNYRVPCLGVFAVGKSAFQAGHRRVPRLFQVTFGGKGKGAEILEVNLLLNPINYSSENMKLFAAFNYFFNITFLLLGRKFFMRNSTAFH